MQTVSETSGLPLQKDLSWAPSALIDGASSVLRGKRDFLEFCVAGLLAGGHVLLEDKPGLGKTTLAKTIAALIGDPAPEADASVNAPSVDSRSLVFKRIQFTPDLLPYDITGVDVFDPESRTFRFVPGPVIANIVLADEINRTTAKVQSALLEVMAEKQVTIGQNSYKLPRPFFVLATQNPVESEGVFRLPAAQLDRFMMRLSIGYPDRATEIEILNQNPAVNATPFLKPVISVQDFIAAQDACAGVFCNQKIIELIADILQASRSHPALTLGASPRAGLHLLSAAKSLAWIRGRDFVTDEDVFTLAPCVLAHRVKLKDSGILNSADAAQKIIAEIELGLTT
ncbi:MAG: MoxR family ATPase [Spirochaetaceae bacterium]|nr:MoxR family ATPase [Spirochaetaceae bacterium]